MLDPREMVRRAVREETKALAEGDFFRWKAWRRNRNMWESRVQPTPAVRP